MNITEKPDALILAECLEGNATTPWTREEVAAELRRQHARIAELEDIADMAIEHVAELRRAVHEAVLEEREECAKVCDELVSANACACQIRARGEPEQHRSSRQELLQ